MRVIEFRDFANRVGIAELVAPVERALISYSKGHVSAAPAELFELPEGEVHVKAAVVQDAPLWSVKVSASVPTNAAQGIPPAHSTVTLFDVATGRPVALIVDDGGLLTGLRTAAAGAVAARLLAPATETLLVVGTGLQARLQAQAFMHERPFERLLVWGRDYTRAAHAVRDLQQILPGVEIEIAAELKGAIAQAQSVVTASASDQPLIHGRWLHAGQHVTAIGADTVGKRELDDDTLRRADRLYVDSLAHNLQVGDLAAAISHGAVGAETVTGELGMLADQPIARKRDEITVAKLVGVGVQDLAAATTVLDIVASIDSCTSGQVKAQRAGSARQR